MVDTDISVYIHWPFCVSKCPYCDFNSHVSESPIDYSKWIYAYKKAIRSFAPVLRHRTIESIYFGGGTPSTMPPFITHDILATLNGVSTLTSNTEITLEVNPTTIEMGKFLEFKNAGINRVSIGVQSLLDANLKFLGRAHDSLTAQRAITQAAEIFSRVSFDLMYALPDQTPDEWRRELRQALAMSGGGHISLYQLMISAGTPFNTRYAAGEFVLPSDDTCREMYDIAEEETAAYNMRAYEISNYAAPGCESRHNLRYWRYQDYLGIGPGAHSRISSLNGRRIAMHYKYNPDIWLRQIASGDSSVLNTSTLSPKDVINEAIIMGLRLTEGINLDHFAKIAGCSIMDIIPANKLDLLELCDGYIRIPHDKLFIMDGILRDVILA